jgi:hypothetical protein
MRLPKNLSISVAVVAAACLLAASAHADCTVSTTPSPLPEPTTCDPGGEGSEVEKLACDFEPFTYGTFVGVGRNGTNSATSIPRITVFEGVSAASISNCTMLDPFDDDELFHADSRASVGEPTWQLGIEMQDIRPGRGDPFGGTAEDVFATTADSFVSITGMGPNQVLDVVVDVVGRFQTAGLGRPSVQLGVGTFLGGASGSLFAAGREAPNGVDWRHKVCPDPIGDPDCLLSEWVDVHTPWPGSFEMHVPVPAVVGNGLWIEFKGSAVLPESAPVTDVIRLDFHNTVTVEILPSAGAVVTMASGRVFEGPPLPGPDPLPFSVEASANGMDGVEEEIGGIDDVVETAMAYETGIEAIARGIAGSGRLLAEVDTDIVCTGEGAGLLRWEDTITLSGADTLRFELEIVGDWALDAPPQGGSVNAKYAALGRFGADRTNVGGVYEWFSGRDGCDPGDLDVGDACFRISNERAEVPYEIVGDGDLGAGPVVIAFEPTLTPDTPTEVEFAFRASAGFHGGFSCSSGPMTALMDLGTPGRYVRMLGVTEAWSGDVPDDSYTIESELGHDYGVARPLVEPIPIPEPASAALGATALACLAILRRRVAKRG